MKKTAEKRKKYLTQKPFQLKYVILGIIAFIITIGLAQMSLYYQLTRLVLQQPQFTGIFAIVQQMNVVFFSWFILGALLIWGGGVFVSHRIVGPLKRLEEMLAKVGRGDISGEMRTRKKDEFKEVAYAFNSMVQGLRRFLAQDHKLAHEIKEDLQEVKHSLSPETILQTAAKLDETAKKLEGLLTNIKM
ncbi:MAG: methyl-accepting chemotaxis protein [Elusimicrobia bacterium]|nr:methyl-accepting chemotaxis protein [Elusimicrobiota bacterium]